MRLHVMSDLHTEFYGPRKSKELIESVSASGVHACILAGDIISLDYRHEDSSYDFLNFLTKRYSQVIYVPGNHDYFDVSPTELENTIDKWAFDRFRLLMPGDKITIGDYTVKGGTLWYTDIDIPDDGKYPEGYDQTNSLFKRGFIDYNLIREFEPWVYRQNAAFKEKVAATMGPKDIIVSHHLPSFKSVAPQFQNSMTNCFFVSDIEDYIIKGQPALYIHGHTHNPFDYKIGNTRVYCNPRGYPNERSNIDFANRILVELS